MDRLIKNKQTEVRFSAGLGSDAPKNEPVSLSVKKLSKSFGSSTPLKSVTFDIRQGELVGLIGRNGTGKTTLLKCIIGAINDYQGSIAVFGKNIASSPKTASQNIGHVLEPAFCSYLSAKKNLELVSSFRKRPKKEVDSLLELVSLDGFANEKPSTFSFGMKQRLGLAMALVGQPKLLILDEPFVGLDPKGTALLEEILKNHARQGGSVVFSSHQTEEVEKICSKIMVLKKGGISAEGPVENFTPIESIRLFFDYSKNPAQNAFRENTATVSSIAEMNEVLAKAYSAGAIVEDIVIKRRSISQLL